MRNVIGYLVLSLLVVFNCASLYAADETKEAATWYVISADSVVHLQRALPIGKKLGEKAVIDSVSIEKDRIKICLKPANKCVYLVRPTKDTGKSLAIEAGTSKLPPAQLADLKQAIDTVPLSIWKKVKMENKALFGLDSGWANAIWYLLQHDAVGYGRKLIESLEEYEQDMVGLKLFKVVILALDNDVPGARKILKQLVDSGNTSSLIQLTDGMLDAFDNKVDVGVKKINSSLNGFPKSSFDRCNTANLLPELMAKNGMEKKSIAVWTALEKEMPDCHLVLVAHATQLLDWGKNDDALQLIETSLKNDRKNIGKLVAKSRILRRLKRIPEALEVLSLVNDIQPNDHNMISMHSTMASTMMHLDDYLAKMLARVAKNDDDLFAKHAAAVMSYYHGDFEVSKKLSKEVMKLMPKNSRARIYNSMSKYQLGDWDAALKGIQKLEEIGTDDPDLYYCYAMIWSGKDTNQARIYLEQYLARPTGPDSIPEKQQRAWKEWEGLKKGIPPKAWQPGEEYPTKMVSKSSKDGDNQSPLNMILIFLLFVGLGFGAGFLLGRKK